MKWLGSSNHPSVKNKLKGSRRLSKLRDKGGQVDPGDLVSLGAQGVQEAKKVQGLRGPESLRAQGIQGHRFLFYITLHYAWEMAGLVMTW